MKPDELGTSREPVVAESAWVAPSADLIGDVTIGKHASVWYQCVLRGDIAPIAIGDETNIQDLTMVHVDVEAPAIIGARVGIGHRAIIHGCTIGDDSLIGMGAIVLSNAVIGSGSLVAAGALVLEGAEIPPRSLVVGVPGRVVRQVDEPLSERIRRTIEHYRALKEGHRSGRWAEYGSL
jgi:carbonic anhydrase/acetyltransferase-like protein (isoleucine patch superfamily)